MMVRTQISLDAEDHRRAKQRAAELGISLAEYMRSVVRRDLGDEGLTVDVNAIFGLGDSGGADVAAHKDEYVGDAVDAEYRRKTARSSP